MRLRELPFDALDALFARVFETADPDYEPVRQKMSYQFRPERTVIGDGPIRFEVILNPERQAYVAATRAAKTEADKARQVPANGRSVTPRPGGKRSLLPHSVPPGFKACPFDHLGDSPLVLGKLKSDGQEYLLVVNARPWSSFHFMLVSVLPDPQSLTEPHLRAGFELMTCLGAEYEGMFNGVSAGASVYHYHLQCHRGRSAIWSNLACDAVRREPFFETVELTTSYLAGWPAHAYLFEATDTALLARSVATMIQILEDEDIPMSLTFRHGDGKMRAIVVPRSIDAECPTGLNEDSGSWSRFGCMEMAGSILLMTRAGYDGTTSENIVKALAQMTVSVTEKDRLIEAFQRRMEA